jgi:hypothetical protein
MYDDCKWAYAYQYSLLIEECAVATRDRSDLALPQRAEAAARRQADLPMHKEKWILQNERGFAVLSAVEDGLSLARAITRHSKRDWPPTCECAQNRCDLPRWITASDDFRSLPLSSRESQNLVESL